MSDPVRQLVEQHNQIRRLFKQAYRLEVHQSVVQRAYAICDLLTVHSRLEHEIVYPVVRDLDEAAAEEATKAHRRAQAMVAKICDWDYRSNAQVKYDLDTLDRVVSSHARWEEDTLFPLLSALATDEFSGIGAAVYTRHQELLYEYPDAADASAATEGFSAGPLI
jgi:hemerythrin superfamily protein